MIRTHAALVAALAACLLAAPAAAETGVTYPMATSICCGDQIIAEMIYGKNAVGQTPGKDAAPAFTDVKAFDAFYKVDTDDANPSAVRNEYHKLHAAGRADVITVGKKVTLIGKEPDPEDSEDPICSITYGGKNYLVNCIALRAFQM